MKKYLIIIDPSATDVDPTTMAIYRKDHRSGIRLVRSFKAPIGDGVSAQVPWALAIMVKFPDAELLVETTGIGEMFRDEILRALGVPA